MSMTLSMCSSPVMRSCAPGNHARAIEVARQRAVQDVLDQRGLARARHAGDGDEQCRAECRRRGCCRLCSRAPCDASCRCASTRPPRCGTAICRSPLRYCPVSDAGFADDLVDRAGGDHLAAVLPGAGPEVDDVIGGANRLLVVLDHDHRVAEVAQLLERARAAARCRAGAVRSTARRGCTARRRAASRSASPAGCAAPRRRTATRPPGLSVR